MDPGLGPRHDPVLVRETMGFLLGGAGLYLDATLGDGGHAEAVLLAEPGARLLGSDRDGGSLAFARERLARFGERVMFTHGTFREIPAAHALMAGGEPFTGALFDFGLSSAQIDDPTRGMSFMMDGPLDLRMDRMRGETLIQRLAHTDVSELAIVLKEYGDLAGSARLARAIVEAAQTGQLATTRQLAAVCGRVLGEAGPKKLAPVFQALRIWVNDEMADIEGALEWLPGVMGDGGVVVTLAYHSGEDRRVKHALRSSAPVISRRLPALTDDGDVSPWQELTKKVVVPSAEEQHSNPRARSARLRAFRRKAR